MSESTPRRHLALGVALIVLGFGCNYLAGVYLPLGVWLIACLFSVVCGWLAASHLAQSGIPWPTHYVKRGMR